MAYFSGKGFFGRVGGRFETFASDEKEEVVPVSRPGTPAPGSGSVELERWNPPCPDCTGDDLYCDTCGEEEVKLSCSCDELQDMECDSDTSSGEVEYLQDQCVMTCPLHGVEAVFPSARKLSDGHYHLFGKYWTSIDVLLELNSRRWNERRNPLMEATPTPANSPILSVSPTAPPSLGSEEGSPLGAIDGSLNMSAIIHANANVSRVPVASQSGGGESGNVVRPASSSSGANSGVARDPPPAPVPVKRSWREVKEKLARGWASYLEYVNNQPIMLPVVVWCQLPSYLIGVLLSAWAWMSLGWFFTVLLWAAGLWARTLWLVPYFRAGFVLCLVSMWNTVNNLYWGVTFLCVYRHWWRVRSWVATKCSNGWEKLRARKRALESEFVTVCGFTMSKLKFYVLCSIIACIIAIIVRALYKWWYKREGSEKKADAILDQAGFADWCSDRRSKALLHASLFVASLISFGNLKSYRDLSPYVNFMGWFGSIVNDSSAAKPNDTQSGCAKAPRCSKMRASGDKLCSDCAASEAVRSLDNPRFMGVSKFDHQKSYAALCEDILTKSSIDWFLKASPELQRAVVQDEEILADVKSSNVYIYILQNSSTPVIKSRRDPMTVARLAMNRHFSSAGLLCKQLERKISTADNISPELGLGWRVSSLKKLELLDSEAEFVPGLEVKEEMSVQEQINLLSGDPISSDITSEHSTYWIYLSNGVLTLWKECPAMASKWVRDIKSWKNSIRGLSSAVDLGLMLIAVLLVYLAYTACFDTICSYLSKLWSLWSPPVSIEGESDAVELEGRGIHARRVAKSATSAGSKESHRREMQGSEGHVQSRDTGRERHETPVSDMQWRLLTRRGEAEIDAPVTMKLKNFVFYDLADLKRQAEAAAGLQMRNEGTNQVLTVRSMREFEQLRNAGWRPFSANLANVPRVSLPLEAVNADPSLKLSLKVLQYVKATANNTRKSRIRLSAAQVKSLEKHLGPKCAKAEPSVRSLFALATAPGKGEVSHEEIEAFSDFLSGGAADENFIDFTTPEEDAFGRSNGTPIVRESVPVKRNEVTFQGKKKISLEANTQELETRECAFEGNGMVCKVKNCPRDHKKRGDPVVIQEEALIHPIRREINPKSFYQLCYRRQEVFVQFGSAVATAYGFLTARHVLFDTTGGPRIPFEEVIIQAADGSVSYVDGKTVNCPRSEQMSPGQDLDFCKFRAVDAEFNKLAQHKDVRVSIRPLRSESKVMRMLRSPRDKMVGEISPITEFGELKRTNLITGVCDTTLNTVKRDSGSPVFDDEGHCIGIHKGVREDGSANVFVLLFPNRANPWFVQAEPLN